MVKRLKRTATLKKLLAQFPPPAGIIGAGEVGEATLARMKTAG